MLLLSNCPPLDSFVRLHSPIPFVLALTSFQLFPVLLLVQVCTFIYLEVERGRRTYRRETPKYVLYGVLRVLLSTFRPHLYRD